MTIDRELHKKCSRTASGKRAVLHLAIEHGLEFGVPSGNRVADHHHLDLAGDVIGAVPVSVRIRSDSRNVLMGG